MTQDRDALLKMCDQIIDGDFGRPLGNYVNAAETIACRQRNWFEKLQRTEETTVSYRKGPEDGFPFYGVFKRADQEHQKSAGFYVLETWQSLDGPRTRVARGGFNTLESAQAWLEEKTGGAGKR